MTVPVDPPPHSESQATPPLPSSLPTTPGADTDPQSKSNAPPVDENSAWGFQFGSPTFTDLMNGLDSPARALARQLSTDLKHLDQVRSAVRWRGHAWKWTLTFHHPDVPKASAADFAYLIPDPRGLRFALPLTDEMVEDILNTNDELARSDYIVEGINDAPNPYQWHWPIWKIESREHVDTLLALAAAKLACMTNGTGDHNSVDPNTVA